MSTASVAAAPSGQVKVAAALAGPPAGNPLGIDVSSWDHDQGKTVDWPGQAAAGMKFAFIKAAEGTSTQQHYTNPFYESDYNGARDAGLFVGSYAFGRPDYGDPVGQADWLVNNMFFATDGKTMAPFVDMEWPDYSAPNSCYGLSPGQITSWLSSYLSRVESRLGRTPGIYTNVNWWNQCTGSSSAFAHYWLDISSCTSSPPSAPGWGTNWRFWQYTIPDCGADRDRDVFNGGTGDLATFAGGTPSPPPPPQAGQIVLPPWPNMVQGDSGANVRAAQYLLRYHLEQIDADGSFGTHTRDAVLDFQYRNNLHYDGEIGPQTWSALLVDVKRGDNSEAVKGLQTELNRYGYALAVDGDFGGHTDTAVRMFQATHGLVVDGDAGPKTWQALVGTHVISLLAHAGWHYVSADNAGASPLIANRTGIGAWEQFDVLNLSNGDIALLAHANNKIVTAENAGASALIANRDAVGVWEDFGLVYNADGSISLRAMANGKYVTAEDGGASPLIANRDAIGQWEEFDSIRSYN